MTSGSDTTHLMVIAVPARARSRALVDEGEERVALACVAGEAAMPLEDRDRLVEAGIDGRHRARFDDGSRGAAEPVAEGGPVVHRDLAPAVADGDEVRKGGHRVGVAAGDGRGEPLD